MIPRSRAIPSARRREEWAVLALRNLTSSTRESWSNAMIDDFNLLIHLITSLNSDSFQPLGTAEHALSRCGEDRAYTRGGLIF
jgi:hypothetical protein